MSKDRIKTDHFKYTDKLMEIAREFTISELALEASDEIDDRHLIDEFTTNKRTIIGNHINRNRRYESGIH